MASQAYYDWVKAGKPYVRARPTMECLKLIQGYGYTVYDYPDDPHLTASPPEDHTPFSATGWPIASKRWVGHAIDIMPPSAAAIAAGAIPLPQLARQIIRDKNAGVPGTGWIKYMNWTDEEGVCRQERWMPDHETRSSTDKGHIHISGRSDKDTSDEVTATGWDPVRRATMDYTEAQMRAFPWQYNGRGISATTPLAALDEILKAVRNIPAMQSTIAGLTTTVQTLAEALAAGGSDLDTAAILKRIDDRAEEDAARDAAHAAEVDQLQAVIQRQSAALAAAGKAQADALDG